jgi:hypothetical protein
MFTYMHFTVFHLNTFQSTWLDSWVPQTLWEYCTILPSSLNHRISWSLWIADVLSHCTLIILQYLTNAENLNIVDLLRWKPHWCSTTISSTSMFGFNLEKRISIKCCMKMIEVISPITLESRHPFSWTGTIIDSFHWSGNFPYPNRINEFVDPDSNVLPPAWISYAEISSLPGDL